MSVFALALLVGSGLAGTAYAATLEELQEAYEQAAAHYEELVFEKNRSDYQIQQIEMQMQKVREELEAAQAVAQEAARSLYKCASSRGDWISAILESHGLSEAIAKVEAYEYIERRYAKTILLAREKQRELDELQKQLEQRRAAVQAELDQAKQAMDDAEAAFKKADHSDGADYHQLQGNDSNCGATSFIVGVNTLLHENRYTDNVAVWEGEGFNGDSTFGIGYKGSKWLAANGLSDSIAAEDVPDDIKTNDQLKEQLDQGRVVVISSGPGSTWQRADGTQAKEGSFPDGHFIVFYRYKDGVFYANDSSVAAEQGAGVAYTEEQMAQWLGGRSNHFATVLYVK